MQLMSLFVTAVVAATIAVGCNRDESKVERYLAYSCDATHRYYERFVEQDNWRQAVPDTWHEAFGLRRPMMCRNPYWTTGEPFASTSPVMEQGAVEYAESLMWWWREQDRLIDRHDIDDGVVEAVKEECDRRVEAGEYENPLACVGAYSCTPWLIRETCEPVGYSRGEHRAIAEALAPTLYMVSPNQAPRSAEDVWAVANRPTSGRVAIRYFEAGRPQVYTRFLARGPAAVVVQYWYFWPENRFVLQSPTSTQRIELLHDGDWEVITVGASRVDENAEPDEYIPAIEGWRVSWVSASQHMWAFTINGAEDRTALSLALTHDGRPSAFVAPGSHALYLPSQYHWGCRVEINDRWDEFTTELTVDDVDLVPLEDVDWNLPTLRWGSTDERIDVGADGQIIVEQAAPLSPASEARLTWTAPDLLSGGGVHQLECDGPIRSAICNFDEGAIVEAFIEHLATGGACLGTGAVAGTLCSPVGTAECAFIGPGAPACGVALGALCSGAVRELCLTFAHADPATRERMEQSRDLYYAWFGVPNCPLPPD